MKRGRGLLEVACVIGLVTVAAAAEKAQPFFDLRSRQAEYAGPDRDAPEPDVTEVRLGYFGPSDPNDPDGGDAWRAAAMAIDQANQEGGYRPGAGAAGSEPRTRPVPFRLVAGWSDQPWKSGAAQVTRMVYADRVWAIIGGPDGATTHLAEQVAAKARVAIVSPGSTDRTANMANVPWMFSLLPGDHLQAPILAEAIAARLKDRPFVLLSAADRDSRQFVVQLRRAMDEQRIHPGFEYVCQPFSDKLAEVVAKIQRVKPAAVVVVANAHASATLVRGVRDAGMAGPIYGSASMGLTRFRREAGRAAEGVIFPRLDAPGAAADAFCREFVHRHRRGPDYAAAATYDAVRLCIAAIRQAGLNRARIADALRNASPWAGACGPVEWDRLGSNTRPASLATTNAE